MILFTLRCSHGHEFEGWFRDGEGFEAQQKAGEIACPECGQTLVEKAVMAPRLGRSKESSPAISPAQFRAALLEMRRQIETHCDYVGTRFPEEARRIHYGKSTRTVSMARPVKKSRENSPMKGSALAASPGFPRRIAERGAAHRCTAITM